ncbi:hypothetical protein LY76DRAFT_614725 [Colletotrichum caudatum]|nr:hypothetical protein LY76DRAFT_614725 [Colletotrichum caudatum]
MIFSEHVTERSEVMVVSLDSGPPRLDLNLDTGRRGTFGSLDSDIDRRFYPRAARSSNDLFTQALEGMDMTDCNSEWGAVRLADLIDFLRTTSPPSGFPSQSESPEKARSLSPARRPLNAGLPNSAIVSKTSSGKSHIAISIPLEYCHVGPDSDWALAVFNATPPLPPTPPVRGSHEETDNTAARPYASERKVTVLKTVSEQGTRRRTKGSVPPMTPYTTPPGSLREPSSTKERHNRMPPTAPQGRRPSGNESNLAQAAIPNARKAKAKSSSKRPENIILPPHRSSMKTSGLPADQIPKSQHLHQGIASDSNSISPISSARSAKAYSMVSIVRSEMPSTTSRQSYLARPGSSDTTQTTLVGESVASRNASTRTAPSRQSRKERVRSLKQRDMEAIKATTNQVPQEEDGEVTPRPRTCDTAISSLRLPSRDGTFGSNDHFPLHGIATKLSASNLANMAKSHDRSSNRISHGTATKISDWQATQETETPGWETAREEPTPGWETAQETPAVDWEKTPLLVEMTGDQVISAAASTRTFGNGDTRDSTLSSEPPRRWGSLSRASWASSVPLLDRIGSFAPSDESATLVVEEGSSHLLPRRAPKSRADSATLSQADAERLHSDSFSSCDPDNQARIDPVDDDQSIAGSIAAFPKPGSGSGPRLSAIMHVAEVVPSSPLDERWSASTLNSPLTVVELSHPPSADDLTPRQSSMPVARLPTVGNTNTAQPDASRGQRQPNDDNKRDSVPVDGDTGEAASLRPLNRSNEQNSLSLLNMSSRELRNHYASLRTTRVNDLAHEMLLNQERLEMRMHRQERNQILFIERLQNCMSELRGLPEDPYQDPQDWSFNDDEDNIYEGLRINRNARHEARAHKTVRLNNPNRPPQQPQPGPRHSSRRLLDVAGAFDDFAGDFVVPRQPSTSHDTPRAVRGSRFQAVMTTPMTTRGGLDAMDPLIRELQLAARVSLETTRTERMETSQVGDYSYGVV